MTSRVRILAPLALVFVLSAPASSKEPGWNGSIVAVGQQRSKIRSTPITRRPYRPLHFYGNTVRRQHYRGVPIPLPRDIIEGARALIVR